MNQKWNIQDTIQDAVEDMVEDITVTTVVRTASARKEPLSDQHNESVFGLWPCR